jgi:hypothetical protein
VSDRLTDRDRVTERVRARVCVGVRGCVCEREKKIKIMYDKIVVFAVFV